MRHDRLGADHRWLGPRRGLLAAGLLLMSQSSERWTLHVCKDCRQRAHHGDRCLMDRRRVWTEMAEVEVMPVREFEQLRAAAQRVVDVWFNSATTAGPALEALRLLLSLESERDA